MNTNKTYVPTQFGPETRFELRPAPPAPFRAVQETEFERLKNQLLEQQLRQATAETEQNAPLRRAANEAAALAWVTPFPLLVFPVLFQEITAAALHRAERQELIYNRELIAA